MQLPLSVCVRHAVSLERISPYNEYQRIFWYYTSFRGISPNTRRARVQTRTSSTWRNLKVGVKGVVLKWTSYIFGSLSQKIVETLGVCRERPSSTIRSGTRTSSSRRVFVKKSNRFVSKYKRRYSKKVRLLTIPLKWLKSYLGKFFMFHKAKISSATELR